MHSTDHYITFCRSRNMLMHIPAPSVSTVTFLYRKSSAFLFPLATLRHDRLQLFFFPVLCQYKQCSLKKSTDLFFPFFRKFRTGHQQCHLPDIRQNLQFQPPCLCVCFPKFPHVIIRCVRAPFCTRCTTGCHQIFFPSDTCRHLTDGLSVSISFLPGQCQSQCQHFALRENKINRKSAPMQAKACSGQAKGARDASPRAGMAAGAKRRSPLCSPAQCRSRRGLRLAEIPGAARCLLRDGPAAPRTTQSEKLPKPSALASQGLNCAVCLQSGPSWWLLAGTSSSLSPFGFSWGNC